MIFVDTSGWFAAFVPTDRNHAAALAWMDANRERLVTTDYVIDELMTLLDRRGERRRAIRVRDACFGKNCAHLEFVSRSDFMAAWDIRDDFEDKHWSFTDCVSRVVMARMGIERAFSFDIHFVQFGTVTVVP